MLQGRAFPAQPISRVSDNPFTLGSRIVQPLLSRNYPSILLMDSSQWIYREPYCAASKESFVP
jgi:hypothetical protein